MGLTSVDEENDLGVTIHRSLKFSRHCAEAARKANIIVGIIYRNFRVKSKYVVHSFFTLNKNIKVLEKVQRWMTRMIPELKNKPYEDRLKTLHLTTLKARRLRGDFIEVFSILKRVDHLGSHSFFTLNTNITVLEKVQRWMKRMIPELKDKPLSAQIQGRGDTQLNRTRREVISIHVITHSAREG